MLTKLLRNAALMNVEGTPDEAVAETKAALPPT
jgi:hypothetical protein